MNLGLGSILILVAVVLFVIAAITDSNWNDLIAWGLAAFAAGHVAGNVGFPTSRR